MNTVLSIIQDCVPRTDVLKGDLENVIFAADLLQVLDGKYPIM